MSQSIVAEWNELMLEAIREGGAKPTATTYQLHLTTAAMYDAWAAYDADAYGHYSDIVRPGAEHNDANKAEAISYAAYQMLSAFFPAAQQSFDDFMDAQGYDVAVDTTDPSTAAGVGNLAAENVFAAREGDGSNYENDFEDTTGYVPVNDPEPGSPGAPGGDDFDPNAWQPLRVPNGTLTDANGIPIFDNNDPSTYDDQVALTPQWGGVTSFNLYEGSDMFRPDAPPQAGDDTPYTDGLGNVTTNDQAYVDQVTEVLEISAGLTNEQKVVAEFWADGPRTESPPGHWNQIAQDIALREGHGIDEDAKLFFALNAAVFDAGIATWEAKYHYDYVRPQSAIRDLYFDQEVEAWAGPDQGTQTIQGQDWQPYQNVTFVTPPFPEFVSGHSTFSMAAAKTIASFVGSDAFYDGVTLGNYDLDSVEGTDLLGQFVTDELAFETYPDGEAPVTLQWDTLTEAAEEAGISRLYGGIHIQDGNLRGLEVGEQVAANAEIRWDALFNRGGNDFIRADKDGGLIVAGTGNDLVKGRNGDDLVELGEGRDFAITKGGDDRVTGGEIRDVMVLGSGDDIGIGGGGADKIIGQNGSDLISGGDGRDCLIGGRDSDVFIFYAGETGFDVVGDFGFGDDRIVLVGYEPDAELTFQQTGRHATIRIDGEKVAVLKRTDIEELSLGDNIEMIDTFVL